MVDDSGDTAKNAARAERRGAVRICCSGSAEGVSINPNRLFRGEIRNVSETGCFVHLRVALKLPPGTYVELRFRMSGVAYNALARVVEALPSGGIRMRFVATDPSFAERIRQISRVRPAQQ